MGRECDGRTAGTRARWRLASIGAVVGAAALLVSCGSSSSGTASPSPFRSLTAAPDPSNFSGQPASPLASAAASAVASASEALASASARASAFEASVNAQTERNRAKATEVLTSVQGSGNATSDVTLTGVPTATTGGLNAAVVTIVNSTSAPASYAVQVDFRDASGKTVDSTVLGTESLAPQAKAAPVAFSRQPSDPPLTPVVVKAERY
ncbi:hypothetical protein ACIRBX_18670 [Kitasatospora sp. NPDC096147]|uniref:hypothetical protein n=1 Tax=Kitasatospora sp. NPDC096147 TaxID=3364093 RepID=UPI0037F82AC8